MSPSGSDVFFEWERAKWQELKAQPQHRQFTGKPPKSKGDDSTELCQ